MVWLVACSDAAPARSGVADQSIRKLSDEDALTLCLWVRAQVAKTDRHELVCARDAAYKNRERAACEAQRRACLEEDVPYAEWSDEQYCNAAVNRPDDFRRNCEGGAALRQVEDCVLEHAFGNAQQVAKGCSLAGAATQPSSIAPTCDEFPYLCVP
ncbi:MAG TPA: hypothetical protein VFX59_07510 [Polyangiales bacterium]|nr:hypothetical protein [Polyangiales bacterium]